MARWSSLGGRVWSCLRLPLALLSLRSTFMVLQRCSVSIISSADIAVMPSWCDTCFCRMMCSKVAQIILMWPEGLQTMITVDQFLLFLGARSCTNHFMWFHFVNLRNGLVTKSAVYCWPAYSVFDLFMIEPSSSLFYFPMARCAQVTMIPVDV